MRKCLLALFVVLTSFAIAGAQNSAPSLIQLGKLTASDGSAGADLGKNMAADGNTVVVKNGTETYIYVKPASGWGSSTENAKLAPSNGTATFFAVAISGNTIVLGALESNLSGDVYVFVRPAGGWSGTVNETAILSDSSQTCFVSAVGISGDTIVTGNGISLGSASTECVFVRPPGGWQNSAAASATLNVPLTGSSSPVVLGISGNTIVAAEPEDFFGEGTLYVYVKPSTGWSGNLLSPTATLITSDQTRTNNLGSAVAINGSTIVASAANLARYLQNEVCIFVEPAGGWTDMTQTATLTEPPNGPSFATSLAVSGNNIVVGAPFATVGFNQFEGAAYVYVKPQSGWKTTSKLSAELSANDGVPNEQVGWAVAVSGGNFFVGAPYATVGSNQTQGEVYVFGK